MKKYFFLLITLLIALPLQAQDNKVSDEDLAKQTAMKIMFDETLHFYFQGVTFAQSTESFIKAMEDKGWKKDELLTKGVDSPEIIVMKGMYNGSKATLTVMSHKGVLPYCTSVSIDTNNFNSAIERRDELRMKVEQKYKVNGEKSINSEKQEQWEFYVKNGGADDIERGKITLAAAHRVFDGVTFDSVAISYFDIVNLYIRQQDIENDI